MTIKHIRWVACIGLLAIISLQYVWLVNTYKLTKESIQFRSNEVFRDATMREVFIAWKYIKILCKRSIRTEILPLWLE